MSEGLRRVVFYRDYRGFRGGHLKVWDYFNHVRHSPRHEALICFSHETVWDASNPWRDVEAHERTSRRSSRPDVLFLAGLDWLMLDAEQRETSPVPVINLIQGIRHADPGDRRYAFLHYRAVRICVSDEVRDAVSDTGRVNGPLFVIPNGIDRQHFPPPKAAPAKSCDVLIVALKQPELGHDLERRLSADGRRIEVLTTSVPRLDFLRRMADARTTAFLPLPREGFYLPALEGMAVGTLVVCPDCVGNRGFCTPGQNCFRPEYTLDGIQRAVEAAIRLTAEEAGAMLRSAGSTVERHSLLSERRAFLNILEREGL